MTYKEYILSKTSLKIQPTSVPNDSDLKHFITLGVREVISNSIRLNPQTATLFESVSDELNINGFKVDSGIVYKVVREDTGGKNEVATTSPLQRYRICTQVDSAFEGEVQDKDSLYYRDEQFPGYILTQDNKVFVYPEPTSTQNYKVYYLNFPEYDNNGSILSGSTDLDTTGIQNFPKSYTPHLVMHGAIECMKKYYHHILYELEDVELGTAYLNTIRIMDRDYEQMFIDRQLLQAQQRQQDRRRRRREN